MSARVIAANWDRSILQRCLLIFLVPIAALLGVPPAPAQAGTACEEAWFSRNLIAHRGGHCFKSKLGKAVFGNDGCRQSGARLSASQKAQITAIAGMEKQFGCKIDTSWPRISVPNRRFIEKLSHVPARDELESGCFGFLGPDVVLRAAPDAGAARVGVIRRGMSVSLSHLPVGDWTFHEVSDATGTVAMGWTKANVFDMGCEQYAG